MRLYVDLDILRLVEQPGFRNPVQALRWKRGDGVPIEVYFYRGDTTVTFPEGAKIRFAAKQRGDFFGSELVSVDHFDSMTEGDQTAYRATPALNREELNALFAPASGPAITEVALIAEISWRIPGQLPVSIATFDLLVANDIIKDDIEFFAKFTASIETVFPGQTNPRTVFRTAIRSSLVSQADAQELARKAAIDLCYRRINGESIARYAYQVRNYEERILRILYRGAGSPASRLPVVEIGRITENRYGAEVLNTPNVMFVDVDNRPERPDKPLSAEDRSTAPLISEEAANTLLNAFCAENPNFGFRVYRTFAGLRYLCTSGLFDPTSALVKDVLTTLNADQSYRVLCKIQKCFRARLTPKPWRMLQPGGSNIIGVERLIRRLDFSTASYPSFRSTYIGALAGYSTCQFVRVVGNPIVVPDCQQIVAFHDLRTRATASSPLA
jgi:hypothetical protein